MLLFRILRCIYGGTLKGNKFLRIEAPHFVAGITIKETAAPILKYMLNWTEEEIRRYCKKKGWTVYDGT